MRNIILTTIFLPLVLGGTVATAADIGYGREERISRRGEWIQIVCDEGAPVVTQTGDDVYVECE